jgi:hypothetical protein
MDSFIRSENIKLYTRIISQCFDDQLRVVLVELLRRVTKEVVHSKKTVGVGPSEAHSIVKS